MGEGMSKMGHGFGSHEHVKTAGEFLDQKTFRDASGYDEAVDKMVTIPWTHSVGEALQVLNGTALGGVDLVEGLGKPVLSAPVMNSKYNTDMGMVDVLDINRWLCKYSVFLRSGDPIHFMESFFDKPVLKCIGLDPSDRVLPFALDARLSDVAEGMFRVGTHRVVGMRNPEDGASPIVSVLTQSRLMAFLSEHLEIFEPAPNTQLSDLKFGHAMGQGKLHTIQVGQPALYAFEKIQAMNVSAVAVVDAEGRLVNSVSASNVRLLTRENVHLLLSPVETFLEALEIKQSDACHTKTTFANAIVTMRKFHLHRIWIVDDDQKLLSVLTVSDVLRRFYDTAELSRVEHSDEEK